jgi:putative ABC transport system ATP-binding protein
MKPDPAVSVRGLNHFFGSGDASTQALFDIDLDLARGEFVILRGASGSGKTTLMTLLAGLRDVQSGDVRVLGRGLNGADEATLTALRRRLGFIFQAHNLHESLTALQNVRMGLELHGAAAMAQWRPAAAHLLTLLGLGQRQDFLPRQLSGGQKQRVAVARALVGNPSIIFADEPTASLDEDSGRTVVEMLKTLGRERGTTSLMITHDARVIDMADRVLTMEGGRITGERT